jgi:hypothetical protein
MQIKLFLMLFTSLIVPTLSAPISAPFISDTDELWPPIVHWKRQGMNEVYHKIDEAREKYVDDQLKETLDERDWNKLDKIKERSVNACSEEQVESATNCLRQAGLNHDICLSMITDQATCDGMYNEAHAQCRTVYLNGPSGC